MCEREGEKDLPGGKGLLAHLQGSGEIRDTSAPDQAHGSLCHPRAISVEGDKDTAQRGGIMGSRYRRGEIKLEVDKDEEG